MPPASLHDRRFHPLDPDSSLASAAAQLRDAFADVAFNPYMLHCPHCVTDEDMAAIGGDVATLTPAVVSRFVVKSGTTWGDPADLRRLVPAILPLAADRRLTIGPALIWAKLHDAGWPDWPAGEVAAVQAFLQAEFARLLTSTPRPAHAAHRWLADVADGIDDLAPFLATWHDLLGPLTHRAQQEAAVGHLVELLTNSPLRPDLPATIEDVIPGHRDQAAQLGAWLTGPGTAHELQRAAVALAETTSSRRIAVASERLRRFTAASARG